MKTRHDKKRIAYFISPHGYGHASRAAGVIEALHELDQGIDFEIFTTIPEQFFIDSISRRFGYTSLLSDIGFVQETPLHSDILKTIKSLDQFLPFDESIIKNMANKIKKMGLI